MLSPFKLRVINIVRLVPEGNVASYGQIATYIGIPRAARQVGWILNSIEGKVDLPWWRIINNIGRISIKGSNMNTPELQRKLLRAEGIKVSEDFSIDIKKYRFKPNEQFFKMLNLNDEYIAIISEKFFS